MWKKSEDGNQSIIVLSAGVREEFLKKVKQITIIMEDY
jgi:hypothetical protein